MASNAASTDAAALSARDRSSKRHKISLDDTDAARLRLAAQSRGMKAARFMREAVLAAITVAESPEAAMPVAPKPPPGPLSAIAKDKSATVRKKLFLTPDENALMLKEAKAAQLLQQDYMRLSVVAAMTNAVSPKRKVTVSRNELAHEISMIAFQLKKVGTNLNQLAKQANTGLVPISDKEILYFMNFHQRVLTMTSAALEKVLA